MSGQTYRGLSKAVAIMAVLSLISAFASISAAHTACAQMQVTVQGRESFSDTRYEYDQAVVRLALDKTKDKYGDYIVRETPQGQNWARTILTARSKKYPNYIFKYSVSNKLPEDLYAIPFPVDLGIVGYRVAFVSDDTKKRLQNVDTLEELRSFKILQGISWLDTDILEYHGFNVQVGSDYEAMFSMIAHNRSELFLRGANELLGEWTAHKDLANFTFDETFLIYYPLPRFLLTSSENQELIARIHEGLLKAYDDGSLLRLWEDKYLESVKFAKLPERKMYRLTNPYIDGIDPSWEKYVYQVPLDE
jgi:hypothetical protein